MKKLLVALVTSVLLAGQVHAQIDPDVDHKGTLSSSTVFNLNIEAVMEMTQLLQKSGAKVMLKIESVKDVEFLIITVNGKPLSPVVLYCKECEPIVFEY